MITWISFYLHRFPAGLRVNHWVGLVILISCCIFVGIRRIMTIGQVLLEIRIGVMRNYCRFSGKVKIFMENGAQVHSIPTVSNLTQDSLCSDLWHKFIQINYTASVDHSEFKSQITQELQVLMWLLVKRWVTIKRILMGIIQKVRLYVGSSTGRGFSQILLWKMWLIESESDIVQIVCQLPSSIIKI